ncbi:MAG: GNAT family N-acetyltransferase [Clostridia bacterium]|nr:GNAT family N-acetyltransferase [Clostridia bacterium]
MNFTIRRAEKDEYEAVKNFYDEVIDRLEEFEYGPKWTKGVYPAYDYLKSSVELGDMYIGLLDGKIVSSMIVNGEANESYRNAKWGLDVDDGEYAVIHALGVMPGFTKNGLGKKMVQYAISICKDKYKSVRLDVLKGNLPANRLYESVGFRMTDALPMFYEDTGWTDFELYEYVL